MPEIPHPADRTVVQSDRVVLYDARERPIYRQIGYRPCQRLERD